MLSYANCAASNLVYQSRSHERSNSWPERSSAYLSKCQTVTLSFPPSVVGDLIIYESISELGEMIFPVPGGFVTQIVIPAGEFLNANFLRMDDYVCLDLTFVTFLDHFKSLFILLMLLSTYVDCLFFVEACHSFSIPLFLDENCRTLYHNM